MTREEEINNEATNYGYLEAAGNPVRIYLSKGFSQGALWADKKPKSPWISVNDDLPYNHEELIYEKDSRFTKSVLVRCINVTNGEEFCKDAVMSKYCSEEWFWETLNNRYKVTHWMPIPELPKE